MVGRYCVYPRARARLRSVGTVCSPGLGFVLKVLCVAQG